MKEILPTRFQQKNRGFNLVEVMVALFVLAVGMLTVLSLQIQAAKHNTSSHLYSQAAFFAQDIVERMRANPDPAVLNSYLDAPGVAATQCDQANCTPTELAAWDLEEWSTQVQNSLPSGVASMRQLGTGEFEITVSFEDRRSEDGTDEAGVPQAYVLVTEI